MHGAPDPESPPRAAFSASALLRRIAALDRSELKKWLLAGLVFMGINAALLYLLVGQLALSVPVGTLIAAEACTLLRFFVNHYMVFSRTNPTWGDCLNYHVANSGAFVIWWVVANVLSLVMHYQLAAILAVGCSTVFSILTNFLWVWRRAPSR